MMWRNMCVMCTATGCLLAGHDRRALVWNEIAGINERSVKSIHVHENVDISELDGTFKENASRDVRLSELGDARIEGSRWSVGAMDGTIYHLVERFQIHDGVLRSAVIEQGTGVAYCMESQHLSIRDDANVLLGLGRFRPSSTLLSRAEFLAASPTLGMVVEDADRVVIQVTERLTRQSRRPFTVRVEFAAPTADVLSMSYIDTQWGHLVSRYSMSEWTACAGARLPLQILYETFDLDVPREVKKRVQDEAARAGLRPEDGYADRPRYQEWVAIRDREVPPPAASRLYPRVVRSKVRIEGVNGVHDASWLAFPPQTHLSMYLSGALDCPADSFDLEPSEGYLGPKSKE